MTEINVNAGGNGPGHGDAGRPEADSLAPVKALRSENETPDVRSKSPFEWTLLPIYPRIKLFARD